MFKNQTTTTCGVVYTTHTPAVGEGATWRDAYWDMERYFNLVIEMNKGAERLAKDAETVVRLKRAYERYGASVGEDIEDYYCELKRLQVTSFKKDFDLLDIWEANDFHSQEGAFDKSVFEAGLVKFVKTTIS